MLQKRSGPALLIVLLSVACLAQSPVIRSTVPRVVTPAVVLDTKGTLVPGAFEDSFQLLDEGVSVPVTVDTAPGPVSLVVAAQTTISAVPALRKLRTAAGLIGTLVLGEAGEVAIVGYDDNIRLLQPFTNRHPEVAGTLRTLMAKSEGRARMLDAAIHAVELLEARPSDRRRILLLVGEGRDRGSEAELAQVLAKAQRAYVTIYTLSFSAYATGLTGKPNLPPAPPTDPLDQEAPERPPLQPIAPPPGPHPARPPSPAPLDLLGILREWRHATAPQTADLLSEATGGMRYSFVQRDGLEQAVTRLGEELHDQYVISFRPNPAGRIGFRRIRLGVRDRPDLTVRARTGYFVSEPEPDDSP